MAKKTFMQGAVILAAAGVIIKALGAVFRIPLGNMISDEGMGYYQTAYVIYVMFLVLSNTGMPVAISRVVSERLAVSDREGAHRVFRVSFLLVSAIGLASFLFCFFQSEFLLGFFPNMENASYSIRAISPALLIVPVMASFRGYFQGMQNMRPTANSQIVEQLFRVAVGLSLAFFLLPKGEQFAAAGAAFGATAGAAFGLAAIALIYYFSRGRLRAARRAAGRRGRAGADSTRRTLFRILAIAVPITIGASIMPIMNFIDLALITNRLSDMGWAPDDVRGAYGQLTGFANPLINLPQILTQSVAMSLVPAVAGAYKRGDTEFLRHNIRLGLRTSLVIGLPCALGIMTLSTQIMEMFFPAEKEAADSAASFLFILAFGIIFLSAVQTLTGVLQGVGRQMTPVRNLFVGAAVKVAVTWVLIAVPSINVKGAAIGTVTAYFVAAALNLAAVRRHTGTSFEIGKTFVKPAVAALVMSLVAGGSYRLFSLLLGGAPAAFATALAVVAGVIVYAAMIFVSGA
ncbi:MAG: polysaccharide biosynthesis protein, partial [Clostridiales Family XIII bacterium]|nr:polysaccharide biosynthesis protein [Clostridiales Family XIII bacterium]